MNLNQLKKDLKRTLENNVCTAQALDVSADRNRVKKEMLKMLEKGYITTPKKDILKSIDSEMRAIAKEYNVDDWLDIDPEDMNPVESFNRGYYRALYAIKQILT